MTRVVVAGGGIAGLTCALALHRAGFDNIRILERAHSVEPLGSGINLMPSAVRELDALGLLDDLRAISVETSMLYYTTQYGQSIWSEPRGVAAGFRWPQLSIHRGRLQVMLARRVRELLGDEAVTTAAEVRRLRTDPDRGVVYRERRSGDERVADCDVLIGADGIRSVIRPLVLGHETEPRGNGYVVWRGTAWHRNFLDGRSMVICGDGVRKVVFYPLGHREDGRCLLNWAAASPDPPSDDLERGNWNLPAPPATFADEFAGWDSAGVDLRAAMLGSEDCFAYPMVDIPPLSRWRRDRTVLIGDAAHAMYPVGSNGATQSVIDACALAHHLSEHDDTEVGLREFERERRPATERIQRANREHGPEAVIDLAAQRMPGGFTDVSEVFGPCELEEIATRYARVSANDLGRVNQPSPYTPAEPVARIEWSTR